MKSLMWSALAEAFKSRDCETGPDLLLNLSLITCLTHRSFKIKHTVRVCSALFPSALSTNATRILGECCVICLETSPQRQLPREPKVRPLLPFTQHPRHRSQGTFLDNPRTQNTDHRYTRVTGPLMDKYPSRRRRSHFVKQPLFPRART